MEVQSILNKVYHKRVGHMSYTNINMQNVKENLMIANFKIVAIFDLYQQFLYLIQDLDLPMT